MAIDVFKLPSRNRVVYNFILEKENGNVRKFANEIGKSQQVISRLFHIDRRTGKYPNVLDEVVDAICKRYDIDKDDFLQGRYGGNIGISDMRYNDNVEEKEISKSLNRIITGDGKPFYDVPFTMGYDLPFNDNTSNPTCLIDFRPYNKCDFWCRATGDSMYPTISDGDIVAFKHIRDLSVSIVNREIYAIELVNDLRTIKRLIDKGDSFVLVADNKEYEDQVISKKDVRRIFRVMGSIKARMF